MKHSLAGPEGMKTLDGFCTTKLQRPPSAPTQIQRDGNPKKQLLVLEKITVQ
jgi:hypothetical protein